MIGTLLALGRFDELRMHVRSAIEEGGLSVDEIKEVLLQQAIYCGVPAANTAFEVLREVVEEAAPGGKRRGLTADFVVARHAPVHDPRRPRGAFTCRRRRRATPQLVDDGLDEGLVDVGRVAHRVNGRVTLIGPRVTTTSVSLKTGVLSSPADPLNVIRSNDPVGVEVPDARPEHAIADARTRRP